MLENAKLYEKDFDSSATRSWAPSTVINGTAYATGLFWQPLQNKDDPYAEIEDSAEGVLEGADLFALKPGKTVQFGVCGSADGYKKGLLSLAASVSTALADRSSFVAVFKVDNGWWYCCVRNDIILSDGDMLFLKEEDAKEQFMSMMTVPDWGRKIAPAEWGVEDTQAVDLNALLNDGVRSRLQKIKALRGPKLYAVIAVSAVVGFWILSSFVTDVLFAPKKKPMVVAPVRPKIMKPVEEKPKVLPWDTVKNPEDVMVNCYQNSMQLIKIMPPGWKINGINCTDGGVTASWRREVGRIAWADKALNESGVKISTRSLSADGNTLIAGISFSLKVMKSPPAYTSTELKNTLNDLFQSLSVPVSLSDQQLTVQPQQTNNSGFRRQTKPDIYKMVKFSFSTPQNPMMWRDILTKFSGLVITNIRYDTQNGTWYYEGTIYVI